MSDSNADLLRKFLINQTSSGTIFVQDTEPDSPVEKDLWVDTTDEDNPVFKLFNGTDWITIGASGGASEPLILGFARVGTADDGDAPQLALLDTGGTSGHSRTVTLTGACLLGDNSTFKVTLADLVDGFTLAYASVLLADATFTNTAWYSAVTPQVLDASRVVWDDSSESVEGTGVAIDPDNHYQISVTDGGVYHFRVVFNSTVA